MTIKITDCVKVNDTSIRKLGEVVYLKMTPFEYFGVRIVMIRVAYTISDINKAN